MGHFCSSFASVMLGWSRHRHEEILILTDDAGGTQLHFDTSVRAEEHCKSCGNPHSALIYMECICGDWCGLK